jgi:hypothetical protein
MTKQTKHERIFLQVCDGGYCGFDNTYCEWRVNEDDVEYIRADVVAEQLASKDAIARHEADCAEAYKAEADELRRQLAATQDLKDCKP